MATFYSNKCLHIQIFMTGIPDYTFWPLCAWSWVWESSNFLFFSWHRNPLIFTPKNEFLIFNTKKVSKEIIWLSCAQGISHKYFNGISFYHHHTKVFGASLNLITPVQSCQFVDPFFTRLSKNSSECGSIFSCILPSLLGVLTPLSLSMPSCLLYHLPVTRSSLERRANVTQHFISFRSLDKN